jgi:hypothetical protein
LTVKSFIQPLVKLCVLALLIRGFVVLSAWWVTHNVVVFTSPDSLSYFRLAYVLWGKSSFSLNGIPEIFRTPGYPLFLIPGIAFGYYPGAVALSFQIILSCFTVIIVFFLGKEIFKEEKPAWIAAWLYAFEPLSMLYSAKLLTETLFTFVLISGTYGFIKFLKNNSYCCLCLSALCFTFLPYIRPVAYFLPVLFILFLGVHSFQREFTKRSLYKILTFCLIVGAGIGYWHWRNNQQTGYKGFSSVSQFNLYFFQGAAVQAQLHGNGFSDVQKEMGYMNPEIYDSLHPEQKNWPADKVYHFMAEEGMRIIRENPWIYFKIHLKSVFKILLDPGANEWLKLFKLYPENGGLLSYFNDYGFFKTIVLIFKDKPLLFWLNMGLAVVTTSYLLLAFLGLIWGGMRRDGGILLFLICLYFVLISAGPQSTARFRHPIMPFMALMAGWGIHALNRFRNGEKFNMEVGKGKYEVKGS